MAGIAIVLAKRKEKVFGKIWHDFLNPKHLQSRFKMRIKSNVVLSTWWLCMHHDIFILCLGAILSVTIQRRVMS